MKQIDFDNGKITSNILNAAVPMLVAQILSLLYNIVDRIYIACIPNVGTAALGAVGLCFSLIIMITAFSNLFGSGVKCDRRKYLLYHDALYRDSGAEGDGDRLFRRWSMSRFM